MTDTTSARPRVRGPNLLLTAAIAVTLAIGMLTMAGPANAGGNNNGRGNGNGHGNGNGKPAPDLGAAGNFTVLANARVTCTLGTISGDVGTNQAPGDVPPGSIISCVDDADTNLHVGTPAAKAAFGDFLEAYADLAPQPGDVCPIITGTLAGRSFGPGVYCVSAEAKTGVLTLTGNGIWIFKVAADATGLTGALEGTNFNVVMSNPNANPCNVTWWVAQAATMTTSAFQGTILAGAGITMSGGTLNGNAYAKADVTFTGTVVTGCPATGGGGNGNGHDNDNGHGNGHDNGNGHDKDGKGNDD